MRARIVIAAVCVMWIGCSTPSALPLVSPVIRGIRFAPIVPENADHAAADLAAAALVSDREGADRALARIERIDREERRDGEAATGLSPQANDLYNAAFLGGRDYQRATETLLDRDDLSPAMRTRLEQTTNDDPLKLADARIRDAYLVSTARLFNSIAEPVGRSIMTTALAPYRLGQSLVHYAILQYRQDSLPLQRRQALAHWKNFLERYPQAPESEVIASRVEKAQVRWNRTQRDQSLATARDALSTGRPRTALYYAERSLQHVPGDEDAERVRDAALRQLTSERARLDASVDFELPSSAALLPEGSRALALAMLAPNRTVEDDTRALDERSPLGAEVQFGLAISLGEAGDEAAMWTTLRKLADDENSAMARHARAALADPVRNAYDGFVVGRRRDRRATATWILLGPLGTRPRFTVDGFVEWLLAIPGRVQTLVLLPLRLLEIPRGYRPPTARLTAIQAFRYLAMHPDGDHSEEVRSWLEDYERSIENWIAALRVAEKRDPVDTDSIEELRERAARQYFEVASREERRDLRNSMLHNVAREFPDTLAGHEAGMRARKEAENLTPHHIRISRGFFEENPNVAGPQGLGIDPVLLDEDPSNGELHPEGVTLIGGRDLEFSYVAAGGDEDDAPERTVTEISEERLARLVARLEEASFRNSLVDTDDALVPDAQRDLVFERARLGLADDIDTRATAEAIYSYRGMRERYGMVRSREAILPFDLVIQGSLADFSLGAFPRLRPPRETPDAVLYR